MLEHYRNSCSLVETQYNGKPVYGVLSHGYRILMRTPFGIWGQGHYSESTLRVCIDTDRTS